MTPETRKPAGQGRAFMNYRGADDPQKNHEGLSQNCQHENYGPVNLLADLLEKHLALRNEIALLRAENARLRALVRGCA
jgi:hypothetical protein